MKKEIIVHESMRGLWYEDGAFKRVLPPGRYEIPGTSPWTAFRPRVLAVTVEVVDVRERELTIKGQEILNRVLAAERLAQAQLVEARTKAEMQRIEADVKAAALQRELEIQTESARLRAISDAESRRLRSESEALDLSLKEKAGKILADNPALLRLRELETLSDLAKNASARIYINFPARPPETGAE